ncbi:hypothetical protein D3C76_1210800 [compost metagenome]
MTISTSCSTKIAVTFRSSSARMRISMTPCFSSVETPLVGSSRINSLGSSINDIPTSRSLRCPSGRLMQSSSWRSRRAVKSSILSISLAVLATAKGLQDESVPTRATAESSRHSRTVCSRNNCGSWKDLAMPRRTIFLGEWPVMSLPAKRTLPLPGLSRPVQMLMKVVLPAPFWPITARRSPCSRLKLMPFATTRPPKASVRSLVCRSAVMLHLLRRLYVCQAAL